MTAKWYNSGLQKILNGSVGNMTSVDIEALLVTSSYTFNDEHDFVSDITNELSGGGYARVNVTGRTVTVDDTNDGATFSSGSITFPSLAAAAGTPAQIVFFLNVGTDATNILLCSINLPGTAPTGNNYVITPASGGIGYVRNVAGAGTCYNSGIAAVMENTVDLLTDTINHTLHTSTHTVTAEDDTYADLDNELSGGNYAEVAMTSPAVILDDTNNGALWDSADPSFASLAAAAGTPAHMIQHSQTDGDQLICQTPLPGTAPDGNNYNVVIAASPDGLMRWRNSAS